MYRSVAIAAALVWTSTGAAWAQSANPPLRIRPFIDVGLFYPDRDADFTQTSSLTSGASFGVGVMLSRQSALRFEAEVPGWHQHQWQRFYDYQPQGSREIVTGFVDTRTTVRTTTFSVLYAYHPGDIGRLRLVWLAGMGLARRVDEITNSDPGTGAVITSGCFSETIPMANVGVDGEIVLTSHLSVVPYFRLQTWLVRDTRFVVRPGMALRWRF
jgi:hypothetical protein